jgi:AcrR family transcriptional regulator
VVASRRFGPRDSATSTAILDATERVLRNRGYAAATSRNVAEEAGIRQGLVYYYFRTMDDLLLATFKRRTAQGLERLEGQVGAGRSVQAIWEDLSQKVDARVVFEFVALSNHHEGIREEARHFLRESRRLQTAAIQAAVDETGTDLAPADAPALAFILYAATLVLARESSIGVTEGHPEVTRLLQGIVGKLS